MSRAGLESGDGSGLTNNATPTRLRCHAKGRRSSSSNASSARQPPARTASRANVAKRSPELMPAVRSSDRRTALLSAPSVAATYPLAGSLGVLRDISFSDHEPTGHRSPNLWWPRDRTWCLVSDYDWQESFFGGSVDCVERLVSDDAVEVMRIDPDGRLDDPVNPKPAGSYSG
jgi:hypothetical protein